MIIFQFKVDRSWADLLPLGCLVDFGLGAPILGQKTTFLVHFPYLLNRLELHSTILTQGSWAELLPFGGLVDFGLVAPFLGQKTTFLVTNLVRAVSLEPFGVKT